MIKEAVAGEKEEDDVEEEHITPPHLKKSLTREITSSKRIMPRKREIPEDFRAAARQIKEEPIFIRIDKFEESLKVFEKTKERISEVDKMLKDIKKLKEEEERELEIWEQEIQNLKNQMEKVDEDIFSKIE